MKWAAAAGLLMLLGGRDQLISWVPDKARPHSQFQAQSKPAREARTAQEIGPDPLVRLGRTVGNATRVENVAVDAYIAQVLAGEGQPRAGEAAQQALAITARTFAMANRNRHRSEGFDLCDTTHCQVLRPATALTTRAAAATSGRVLLQNGQPAFVFYSAWCGGHTELASQIWPGAIDHVREPLEDDACEDEPAWTSEVRAADIERALRATGHTGSRLRGIRVLARNESERVTRLRVDGFTPSEIGAHDFRMAVTRVAGVHSVKSTAFDVDRSGNAYRFRGRGFGHGVGLCVIGAGRRAARGESADEILRFYFPGLAIGTVSRTTTTVAAPVRAAVPRKDTSGLELALPAGEEAERVELLALIQRSRDEIAKQTGVTAPPLRVTVHASVDSFGRVTGQPWWVPGATTSASIDLVPIAMLRQQGQLERTIRHELTHALLDAALAKKPMWVREGAAAYFANPAARTLKPQRVQCPSDEELLRPVSAGAQRDAYARAESCFTRAMAGGKRWNEIP